MRKRSLVMLTVVFVFVLMLVSCGQRDSTPVPPTEPPAPTDAPTLAPQATDAPQPTATLALPTEPPRKVGLAPEKPLKALSALSGDAEASLAGGKALDELLAERGVYTEFALAGSPAAAIEALCSGLADIAWLTPLGFVAAEDACGAEIVFVAERNGNVTHSGEMLARAEGGPASISDLQSARIAFTERSSVAGYLLPAMLLMNEGLDLREDLGEILFAGSDEAAVRALYEGQADVAAIDADLLMGLEEQFPDIQTATAIIARTGEIPYDTISVRPDLDAEVKIKFKLALAAIATSGVGQQLIDDAYGWSGLAEGETTLFEPLRQAGTALDVDLQSLITAPDAQ